MVESNRIKGSKYWFTRAQECRALAEAFHNEDIREKMLGLAEISRRMGLQVVVEEELAAMIDSKAKAPAA